MSLVRVYSNNGLSYRCEQSGYAPQAGEVSFPELPLATSDQLAAAFAGYTAAVAAQTAAENAGNDLAAKISSGITITSTGNTALSAVYALDSVTLDQIGAVARDAAAGLGLPGGGSSFAYPDANGIPHTFLAADIQRLYKAMRDLLFQLNQQSATEAAGGSPSWPSQSATIA